jgi:hypothetical protein
MTYSHRRWHAWLWVLLGPLVWAGFLAGAFLQPAAEPKGARRSGSQEDTRAGHHGPSRKGPS